MNLRTLRTANLRRLPLFRNSRGEIAHGKPDGSDWSIADWVTAVTGELGEFANFAKKFKRGDIDESQFRALASKELADVLIYLDILAYRCGIDLATATINKFNEVSVRVAAPVFIKANGVFICEHTSEVYDV